jgi:glycosyltransferase involved in cell wall biosynthesis
VPDKKAMLGLKAFDRALAAIPAGTVLHIVGSGPQEEEIRDYVTKSGLTDRVRLYGWVSDLSRLAPIFLRCRGLVAPGYIGLNATQALGFGLPVVYPRDDPHAPEIEALDATNSAVFETDDVDGCCRAIAELYKYDTRFDAACIADAARRKYSTERMIEPFVLLAGRG